MDTEIHFDLPPTDLYPFLFSGIQNFTMGKTSYPVCSLPPLLVALRPARSDLLIAIDSSKPPPLGVCVRLFVAVYRLF